MTSFVPRVPAPSDGRLSAQNISARRLILQAFNIEATEFQLSGGEGWIESETYDLNAKSDVAGSDEQQPKTAESG